jgi:hypothetical protein
VVNWEAKPNDERDLRAGFVIGEVVAGIEVGARASRGTREPFRTLVPCCGWGERVIPILTLQDNRFNASRTDRHDGRPLWSGDTAFSMICPKLNQGARSDRYLCDWGM